MYGVLIYPQQKFRSRKKTSVFGVNSPLDRECYILFIWYIVIGQYLFNRRTNEFNKNDTGKLVIFVAALHLSFVAWRMYRNVKVIIHYYGGRFIFDVRIIRVTSSGNASQ